MKNQDLLEQINRPSTNYWRWATYLLITASLSYFLGGVISYNLEQQRLEACVVEYKHGSINTALIITQGQLAPDNLNNPQVNQMLREICVQALKH